MTEFPDEMGLEGAVDEIAHALLARFGDDAKVVARIQIEDAAGEHRVMWEAVLAALSGPQR